MITDHEKLVNQLKSYYKAGAEDTSVQFSSSPSEGFGKLFQEFSLSEAKCSVEIMVSNHLNSKTTVRPKVHNFLIGRRLFKHRYKH